MRCERSMVACRVAADTQLRGQVVSVSLTFPRHAALTRSLGLSSRVALAIGRRLAQPSRAAVPKPATRAPRPLAAGSSSAPGSSSVESLGLYRSESRGVSD